MQYRKWLKFENKIMISKQAKLKAKLPLKLHEITKGAYCHDKQKAHTFKIIDKATEKTIIQCVVSSTKNGSTAYADLWVGPIKENKIPKKADYSYQVNSCYDNEPPKTYATNHISGQGSASGHGYDKISASIADAIDSCGIVLYGTVYSGHVADFKKVANVGGSGEHEKALLAIAYVCGYNNIIMVQA